VAESAEVAPSPIEAELREVGGELHAALPSAARHPIRALDQRAMRATGEDRELRAALFRLVDVTPACRSLDDLARHLGEYLEGVEEPPPPLATAMRAANTRTGRRALGAAASLGIRHMAHRFIIGASPSDALDTLESLWRGGTASSLDLLGEATVTEAEADRYAERCAEALDTIADAASGWPERPLLEADSSGVLPRVNLSAKVTALTPLIHPQAPELGREDAARRVRPLLRRAAGLGAHLHFDMESLDTLETTLGLALELLGESEFREGPSAGLVLQAYLRDSPTMLDGLLAWAKANPREGPLTVRLVKGAYWDHEIVEARQEGWSAPVFERKADCDRNFEELTRRLLEARPLVRVAIASHNLRSIAHAIAYDRALGGQGRDLELQVLRGLGDELAEALAAGGHRVRAYCPVGDLVAGMAYLVRRLLENTANESFLGEQQRGASLEELLAPP
jgi:RHH-type proline utilization regulon transcriptional repressor/proline dehydrogenase/delta 1-pyrroline-5-carboxylate dehydrogenase